MNKTQYKKFLTKLKSGKLERDEIWEDTYREYTDTLYIYPANNNDTPSYRVRVTYRYFYEYDDPVLMKAVLIDDNADKDEVYELTDKEWEGLKHMLDALA